MIAAVEASAGVRPGPPAAEPALPRVPVSHCRILVVDDAEFNRALIGALLAEAGYFDVDFAEDGFQALEKIRARVPDLLILDIMMPGMDGFEVCRRLRADHAYADLPVLVQTALSSSGDRNLAFAAGTTDLISKPIDRGELLARVRIHLENLLMIRSLRDYRQRVESELAVARSMYEHLLPTASLRSEIGTAHGVDVRAHTALASETGGIVWGLLPLADRRFGVYLLEVPGSGVTAALNAFRLHTLIQETAAHADDPGAFLSALDERAYGLVDAGDPPRALYGVLDVAADTFLYASAAAPAPLLVPPGRDPVRAGTAGGPPLGSGGATAYAAERLAVCPLSVLLLRSRGMAEIAPGPDAAAGSSRLEDAVRGGSDDAFGALVAALEAADGGERADDRALVWIDRRPSGP